jgi:Flp pilus assembly pilin Flp
MGVEPVRLRGPDDGGSAVEAALLMAAMTLVLLPILYALGRTAGSALDSPCEALAGQNCEEANTGSGGYKGAMGRAQSSRTSERWVQQHWTSDRGPTPDSVDCPPLENTPPETIDCQVQNGGPGGATTTVKVKVDEHGVYSWA